MQSLIRHWSQMDILNEVLMGTPVWTWTIFLVLVFALLILDLGVINKSSTTMTVSKSLKMSAFYILIGLSFAGFVWFNFGQDDAMLYLTGFVIEKTLAIDNVFVIAMIFGHFAIPSYLQHRVLLWGIIGVLVLRAIMIVLGSVLVEQYSWVLYIFAAFLVFTGIKMLSPNATEHSLNDNKMLPFITRYMPLSNNLDGEKFFTREEHPKGVIKTVATPLFAALIMIEIADLIFAIDSIPAIFAITTDPFLVFTSNIFAILGLRALYFALAAMIDRFKYLKVALAALLIFIGSKIFIADLFNIGKFPPMVSLSITFAILGAGIFYSLYKTREAAT